MKDSHPFTMFNTIQQTINFSLLYTKEYIKRDLKSLLLVFVTTFIILFSIFYVGALILTHKILLSDIDIADFEDPIFSGIIFTKIFGILFSDLIVMILFLFLCLGIIYSFTWHTNSKSFFIVQINNLKDCNNYNETLQDNLKNRMKIFFDSFIPFLLSIGLFFTTLFVIRQVFLYLHLLDSTNSALSLLSIIFILFISFIFVGFTILPTQLYAGIVRIENNNFKESVKRTYQILSGWKVKLKFISLLGIIGIFGYFYLGSLLLLMALFLTMTTSINFNLLPIFIMIFSLVCSLYFIILFEIGSIVIGNLYGQIIASLFSKEIIQSKQKNLKFH